MISKQNTRVWILNQQKKYKIDKRLKTFLQTAVLKVLETEKVMIPTELSMLLTDDSSIRDLNLEYRGKNRPTDVLSFPMYDRREIERILSKDSTEVTGRLVLGDIVISLETAGRQAGEYGHSFEREAGFLAVHGVLHLLGYDHIVEDQRELMRGKEEEILQSLGLARDE